MKLKEIQKIYFRSGDDESSDLRCYNCGTPYGEAAVDSIKFGSVSCPHCGGRCAEAYLGADGPQILEIVPLLGERYAVLLEDQTYKILQPPPTTLKRVVIRR